MTVLVALEHADLDDIVTVPAARPRAASRRSTSRPGERLTVRELVEAALIQSANDAAVALADYVGDGSRRAFVALMNAKASELGLRDTHFANPDGLDAPGHYSSARDVTRLARVAMRSPVVREIVRTTETTISGGRRLETLERPALHVPRSARREDGPHERRRMVRGRRCARPRLRRLRDAARRAHARRAQRRSARLLAWGISRYRRLPLVEAGHAYASAELPYGKGRLRLVAAREPATRVVRLGRSRSWSGSSHRRPWLCPSQRAEARRPSACTVMAG